MTLHPLERLWQQTKEQNNDSKDGNNSNNNNKKIVDVDKEPLYVCETRRTKNKNDSSNDDGNSIVYIDKRLLHPSDVLKQKTKKLEIYAETITEVLFINTGTSIAIKELIALENRINDNIIKNLPEDNDRYYIEQKKGSDTFKILEDAQQK